VSNPQIIQDGRGIVKKRLLKSELNNKKDHIEIIKVTEVENVLIVAASILCIYSKPIVIDIQIIIQRA
jgi:hypothetical protein